MHSAPCGRPSRTAEPIASAYQCLPEPPTEGVRMRKRIVLDGRDAQGVLPARERRGARDWEVRGPFCDGWPIYHAVHRPRVGRHLRLGGQRVARGRRLAQPRPRRDLGAVERGARSTRSGELKLSKVSRPRRGARARARRRRGGRRLREQRRRRHLVAARARSTTSRAATSGTSRRTSRRATSGCRASCRTPTTRTASRSSSRASASSRRRTTAPPGRRATRDCGPSGRCEYDGSASASTSS